MSWVVSFVPLLSLGVLTWPLFTVLAIRARSGTLAAAALGYAGLFVLGVWSIRDSEPLFDLCWSLLMLGGTVHAIVVRHRWFGAAGRPDTVGAPGARTEDVGERVAVLAHGPARAELPAEPVAAGRSMQRLLDEIDELVDDSLRDGEPRLGFGYGDPAYPPCPNPHCGEPWHGLKITARMAAMRDLGDEVDADYDHRTDDSPVLCPGSTADGAWSAPDQAAIEAWWAVEYGAAEPDRVDAVPDPLDAARARADTLWAALARPAVLLAVASWLVAFVSMFGTGGPSRWASVVVAVAAPLWLGWFYGRHGALFPAGYVRARLRGRAGIAVAVTVMVCAGWVPVRWTGPAPDPATAYLTLVAACALACVGHAVVQIGRSRPVAGTSMDEASEYDPAAHGENLVLHGFGWMVFGLPVTLLLGWILSYFAAQPGALWAAVAVVAILALSFFVEGGVVKFRTGHRDGGELPMIGFFTIGIGALLVWSLLRIVAIPATA
ncbi:hypothetical protein [Nocardia rhizosphaerae]|uniref:Uncharacterized protein n=1 Tax=Nocardia rhizosphaerae TaxID=1691571 RepID=A0ABV8LC97_9NOCA